MPTPEGMLPAGAGAGGGEAEEEAEGRTQCKLWVLF